VLALSGVWAGRARGGSLRLGHGGLLLLKERGKGKKEQEASAAHCCSLKTCAGRVGPLPKSGWCGGVSCAGRAVDWTAALRGGRVA